MGIRYHYDEACPEGYHSLIEMSRRLKEGVLGERLIHMVELRASQINGCAFCIDMHWKDARAAGETEQRLYGLDAWRESPYYSARERAALEWTEALTRIGEGHVSDAVFEAVKPHFSDRELAELTTVVVVINSWNRIVLSDRTVPGTYQPAPKHGEPASISNGQPVAA